MDGGTDWLSTRVYTVMEPRRSLRNANKQGSSPCVKMATQTQRTPTRRRTPSRTSVEKGNRVETKNEKNRENASVLASSAINKMASLREAEESPIRWERRDRQSRQNASFSLVAGITEAAAAMAMRSPPNVSSKVPEASPISVLLGPGLMSPIMELRSPTPEPATRPVTEPNSLRSSAEEMSSLRSSRGSHCPLDPIGTSTNSEDFSRTLRKCSLAIDVPRQPTSSEESMVAGWTQRRDSQMDSEGCSQMSRRSIEREQMEDDAIVSTLSEDPRVPFWENSEAIEEDEPGSPTTPCVSCSPIRLECPDAPNARNKELTRQSSLNDTKLLVTTHLKRSFSVFHFDRHFEFLREIGRGSSSTVYEARDRRRGTLCAVKMSRRQFRGRDDRDRYLHELQSVASLSEHRHVVKYYRGWQQDAHFYIQMELCEGGSLRSLLDCLREPLEESQIWKFVREVASGLEHIHAAGVLHLDVKPDNVFLDVKGDLKIGDFGLAVIGTEWDWEEGDGAYVAPELLQGGDPSPSADMYSFGAMLYEWASGIQLPRSRPAREGDLILPPGRSASLEKLVRSLLLRNPQKRPTATDVLAWDLDMDSHMSSSSQ